MAFRSLAEDLRARDDEALRALLAARPDLISPVPPDMGALAARVIASPSVRRALDGLTAFELQVVEVLSALPEPTTAADVERLLGADPTAALEQLRRLALVWGDDNLRLVRTVRQLLPTPAGLGPSAASVLPAYGPRRLATLLADLGLPGQPDPIAAAESIAGYLATDGVVEQLLEDAPEESRAVLGRLTWGPPSGRVADAHRDVSVATVTSPVDWLLARALLVATEESSVVLPLEVAVSLRGGRVHRELAAQPPQVTATRHDTGLVDRTAAGGADNLVRLTTELLETWSTDGPPVLRAGGLGVRELRKAADGLDTDESTAAFVMEVAFAAGLVGRDGGFDETWRPTEDYDAWLAAPVADRWTRLTEGWLRTTRVPSLVGSRDERDRPINALGLETTRAAAPSVRLATLRLLADLPRGSSPTAESVTEALAWHAPRRATRLRADLVAWTLREAELLGVTGLGALASYVQPMLQPATASQGQQRRSGVEGVAQALAPLLPQPVDEVLLQADLTAVAPGPLVPDLAREIGLVADVESTGGATVYRFSEASVRRGLDAGRSADDILATLAQHSRTPVPQPLSYLVGDVARRHGRVRVGTAGAYVRSDDESALAELLADRRAASLGLRRLAPTVLIATAGPELVLERLRAIGLAPAAESADGAVLVRRPDAVRARPLPMPPPVHEESAPPQLVEATVRAIRRGDAAPRGSFDSNGEIHGLTRLPPGELLELLRDTARAGGALWIGYVNAEGQSRTRVIEPIRVEAGQVSAFDHLRQQVRTFAVHRITGVAPVAD